MKNAEKSGAEYSAGIAAALPIRRWEEINPRDLFRRDAVEAADVERTVAEIIETVRRRGDDALREYARRFDGVELDAIRVPEEELERAYDSLNDSFRETLLEAAANIERFHEKQIPRDYVLTDTPGVVMGLRHTPIEKVGICVPRSPSAFPSTILMNVIPARLAGVREIVIVTPPDPNGQVSAAALGAAYIAAEKVTVCRAGGAQGVAALAYGTESVPAVDKIVGPGGVFVATAKRQVSGHVGIDMFAGPSEILVLADGMSNPRFVAADLLSQAEHDENAAAVLVTDSADLAEAVRREVAAQLRDLPRREIAAESLRRNGMIFTAENLTAAAEAVNRIAPEHLELCVEDPFALLPRIRNAGSVFLGRSAPEALGDYFAGPNHTLPTAGTARFSSPLGVWDFMKRSSFLYYTEAALDPVADRIAEFAEREGLHGHARSVAIRKEKGDTP